jgi:hypothetical protein
MYSSEGPGATWSETKFGRRVAVACLLALTVSGCGRWRPNTPVEVRVGGDTTQAFTRLLASLRRNGYAVLEQDPGAGYVRIRAKTTASQAAAGGMVAAPDSWFGVQLNAGKVVLRASGYLVRENDTIRRNSLDDEMHQLAEQLRRELGG